MKLLVAIPTYNNERSIAAVVRGVLAHAPEVLVVNDGSTDATETNAKGAGARIVRHDVNKGKGEALKTALKTAEAEGYTHVLTIDGDGQHEPNDIPVLVKAAAAAPDAIILGQRRYEKMPEKNRFGNAVSNFWVNLAMGTKFADTQCGLRVYPASVVSRHRFRGTGYEFETEVLIRHKRSKRPIVGADVDVYYPPPGERVSHFVPSRDATRIVFLVMRFLFLPRFLWALALFTACAPAVNRGDVLGLDQHDVIVVKPSAWQQQEALKAAARPFSAQQTIVFETGKDKRKASGLFIVYPGRGYRLRVLGPMGVTAFDVAVRCGKFKVDARDKSATGTLAEAREKVQFFPVAELLAALSLPENGAWDDNAYEGGGVSASLHQSAPAFSAIASGELTVQVNAFDVVDGSYMPHELEVTIGTRAKLHILNDEIAFDAPPEAEALGEITCDS